MPVLSINSNNLLSIDGGIPGAIIDKLVSHNLNPSDVQRALNTRFTELAAQVKTAEEALAANIIELADNEALQVRLVTEAKTARAAGNMDYLDAILAMADNAPTLVRARQARAARIEAKRAELAAAEAEPEI